MMRPTSRLSSTTPWQKGLALLSTLLVLLSLTPFNLSPKELGARDDVQHRVERLADLLLTGILARETPKAP